MPVPRSQKGQTEPARPPASKRVDRLTDVTRASLTPGSLVGSYFHGGPAGTPLSGHQGCVVAEVAPQVYLVELFSWVAGDSTHQRLVQLSDMAEWQFYDDATWMKNTSEHGSVPWREQPGPTSTSTSGRGDIIAEARELAARTIHTFAPDRPPH